MAAHKQVQAAQAGKYSAEQSPLYHLETKILFLRNFTDKTMIPKAENPVFDTRAPFAEDKHADGKYNK